MDLVVIILVSFLASMLTFFSGFGLGTILMPVMALFFPLEIAIATTAVVHLFNNIFKLVLTAKNANLKIALNFGLPAILAAYSGAMFLIWLEGSQPLATYQIANQVYDIHLMNLIIAGLMIIFSLFEIIPVLKNLSFPVGLLPIGGLISGFFGGLSGHQGALRSAFLIRFGLKPMEFIATGIVIAVLIDITRIFVYANRFVVEINSYLVGAILAAFTGAFIGNRLIKKMTITPVRIIISVFLFLLAVGIGSGILQ